MYVFVCGFVSVSFNFHGCHSVLKFTLDVALTTETWLKSNMHHLAEQNYSLVLHLMSSRPPDCRDGLFSCLDDK